MNGLKNILLSLVIFTGAILPGTSVQAQNKKGNKKVVKETREIRPFEKLEVGGAFNVYFTQKDTTTLLVEADENLLENISTTVSGKILRIKSTNIRNAKKLNIYLTSPDLTKATVSGAANLRNSNIISGNKLAINASGAADVTLSVNVNKLVTEASGAADIELSGAAETHEITASGASRVNAEDLNTQISDAAASGAAHITLTAQTRVNTQKSGAGSITIYGNPEINVTDGKVKKDNGLLDKVTVGTWDLGDNVNVKVGKVSVRVIDGDSTIVTIGNRTLSVDDDGHVKFKKSRKQKFNGHWAGFDLGVNGYVDNTFGFDVPQEYDFLKLKYEKSINVNVNIYEQNFNLVRNKFGMITGIGLRWNNYRFSDNVVLIPDSSAIYGYHDNTRNWEKSKLVVNYLQIPLLFEYQTNRYMRTNSFHITAGMVAGWRYCSHTKMMYRDDGKHKPKDRDSFHLNPFRFDATVRIGWGIINLYATYAINPMFMKNEGPELYPFAVGLTLVGW